MLILTPVLAGEPTNQPPPLQIAVDGEIWYDGNTYVLAIANGSRFGAGMQIAPTARADDGQLELTLIERTFRRKNAAIEGLTR